MRDDIEDEAKWWAVATIGLFSIWLFGQVEWVVLPTIAGAAATAVTEYIWLRPAA